MIWRDYHPSLLLSLLSLTYRDFSLSLFLLWCTTTIGGWQQITTIAITARAIRCRYRRWFRRLIIIALSRSGLPLLRSSTLLLSSSRRFHRSRCSSRITTTTATSPTVIHDSYLPLLYFFFKKKTRTNILFLSQRGIFIQLPMNVNWTMSFFLLFVILIQLQVWTCKQTETQKIIIRIQRLWVAAKLKSSQKHWHLTMRESSEKHGKWWAEKLMVNMANGSCSGRLFHDDIE